MDILTVTASGQFGTLTGSARTEVDLVAAIVVLAVILLGIRYIRSRGHRRRKAGGSAYFDREAARYGPTGRRDPTTPAGAPRVGPSGAAPYGTSQPMSPSFTSATREPRPRGTQRPVAPGTSATAATGPGLPAHTAGRTRTAVRVPTVAAVPSVASAASTAVHTPSGPSMTEPPVIAPDGSRDPSPTPGVPFPQNLPGGLPAMPSPPSAAGAPARPTGPDPTSSAEAPPRSRPAA